jgi:hypothetical protein
MRRPAPEKRPEPRRYEAARVDVHCPTTPEHERQLVLAHATIYPDGWAHWLEDGHEYCGYIQAGRCCHPPEVSML